MTTTKKRNVARKNTKRVNSIGDSLYVRVHLLCGVEREKEGMYSTHCAALNLYSQGDSEEEAKRGLEEAISVFIETCLEMGTLAQVLEDAGFSAVDEKKVSGKQVKIPAFIPASFVPSWVVWQ